MGILGYPHDLGLRIPGKFPPLIRLELFILALSSGKHWTFRGTLETHPSAVVPPVET